MCFTETELLLLGTGSSFNLMLPFPNNQHASTYPCRVLHIGMHRTHHQETKKPNSPQTTGRVKDTRTGFRNAPFPCFTPRYTTGGTKTAPFNSVHKTQPTTKPNRMRMRRSSSAGLPQTDQVPQWAGCTQNNNAAVHNPRTKKKTTPNTGLIHASNVWESQLFPNEIRARRGI